MSPHVSSTEALSIPVTDRIARISAATPGWTPPDQLLALHMLAIMTAPLGGDVLEIGSWCGRSTSVLGHACAASDAGIVHAVDLFPSRADWVQNADGTYSIRDSRNLVSSYSAYTDQTVWAEPFLRDIAPIYERSPELLDVFNETIAREGLVGRVRPFRGTAIQWAASLAEPVSLRLAFIDGDHGYDAVRADIETVERRLLPGGWIAFDDAFSHYEGVNRAISDAVIANRRYSCAHQISRKFFAARLDH